MTRGYPDYQQARANPRMGLVPSDENVVVSGTWSIDIRSSYTLLSSRYSSETDAYAEFIFQGRLIGLLYHKASDLGIANIEIDDVAYDDIDMYAAADLFSQFKIIARNLTAGEHTLKITCSGTKNASSSGNTVVVDGFIVLDASNPALCERVNVGLITPVWDQTRFRHLYALDITPHASFIPQIGLVGWDGSDPYRVLVDTSGRLILGSRSQALVQRATTYDLIVQLRHAGVEIDPRAVTIQSQANPFTSDIDVDDDAVQALLAGGLPAALDTGALKVREQNPLTSINIGNWPADYPDSSVATLLAGGLPSALVSDKLKVRASEIETLIGEVQASPTANTLLARLKALEGYLDGVETDLGTIAGDTTSLDGKIPSDPAKESGKLTTIESHLSTIKTKLDEIEDALGSVDTDYLRCGRKYTMQGHSGQYKAAADVTPGTWYTGLSISGEGELHGAILLGYGHADSKKIQISIEIDGNAISYLEKCDAIYDYWLGTARWPLSLMPVVGQYDTTNNRYSLIFSPIMPIRFYSTLAIKYRQESGTAGDLNCRWTYSKA